MRKAKVYLAILLALSMLFSSTTVFAAKASTTAPAAPTIGISPSTPTNGNVTVTVNYPSTATVRQYKLGETGTWTKYAAPFTVTGNMYVYAQYQTKTGLWSAIGGLSITNIDKTPPVNPTFTVSNTLLTNQNVSVTINYSSDSTVKQYRVGSSTTWINYTTPIVLSTNDTIYAKSSDNAGNWSATTIHSITNIDKTAPAIPVLAADKVNPTNEAVGVTISYSNDSNVKQYKIGAAGTWTSYSAPVVVSTNTTVFARAQDLAGNWSAEGSLVVSNIDRIPPIIPSFSASTYVPTNQNVSITINFSTDSTAKQYKIGISGLWTDYTVPVTLSSNDIIYAKASDMAGNWSPEASYEVTNIDKTAPMSPVFTVSTAEPTNQEVALTITYSDDSVIKQYKAGSSGSWTDYMGPVFIDANDTIYARACDNAGNWSSEAEYAIGNIDRTPPDRPVISASDTAPVNHGITVSLEFSTDSTIKLYRIGDYGTWMNYSAPISVDSNCIVYAKASDSAGNWSSMASYIVENIDNIPPAQPVISSSTSELTNQDISIDISFSDDSSTKLYKVGSSGLWLNYSGPLVITENGTIYAKASDNAGNWSSETVFSISNIDKTAPGIPEFSASSILPTNQSVTVSISFSSDSSIKLYRLSGSSVWVDYLEPITFEANDTLYAKASDNAGNWTSETSYVVANISKAPPADPTFLPSATELTNQDVVLSIIYGSSSTVRKYKIGDSGLWSDYVNPISLSSNSTIFAKASDDAGNWSNEVSYNVNNIDKTAPLSPSFLASSTVPTNQPVTVIINFSEDSNVKQYKLGATDAWTDYTAPVVISTNSTIYARASDAAGNWSSEEGFTVSNIDTTAPEKATFTASTTALTDQPVKVTINYSSDSTVKQYKLGLNGVWAIYSAPVTITANNTTVYAKAQDAAGNWSGEASYSVTNIRKTVMGYTVKTSSTDKASYNSMVANTSVINEIATATYAIDGLGNLNGLAPADQISYANSNGIRTKLMVSNNFDSAIAKQMLESPANRQNLKNNILNQLKANNYKGVDIDIENIPAANRSHFTTFMSEIHSALKPLGYEISVAVPAKTVDSPNAPWNYAFDFKALADYSDFLMIMAYDEHYPGGTAGSIASIGWVTNVVNYALTVVPKEKIVLGMAAYGYDWVGTTTKAYSVNGCINLANQYGATINFDNTTKSKYFNYTLNGVAHTVWFEDADTIAYKLDLANAKDLKGVGIWRLGLENTNYMNMIKTKLNK